MDACGCAPSQSFLSRKIFAFQLSGNLVVESQPLAQQLRRQGVSAGFTDLEQHAGSHLCIHSGWNPRVPRHLCLRPP